VNERKLEDAAEAALGKLGETALPLRELETLARALLLAETVEGVLERIVYAAHLLISHADVVSITLRRGEGDYHTPVHTDDVTLELDRLQYAFEEGPCLDAAHPDGPAYARSGNVKLADLAKLLAGHPEAADRL
jgi:hypothetical protein